MRMVVDCAFEHEIGGAVGCAMVLQGTEVEHLGTITEVQRGELARCTAPDEPVVAPQPEPRPDGESVVMAIKRLTRTYPMLDRRKLMGPTSLLVSQHAQGRAAVQIIDELEVVFERHYSEQVSREEK